MKHAGDKDRTAMFLVLVVVIGLAIGAVLAGLAVLTHAAHR